MRYFFLLSLCISGFALANLSAGDRPEAPADAAARELDEERDALDHTPDELR